MIDNKKYSGADFIEGNILKLYLDEHHHVIQLNKLKFKQNNQIKRLIDAIDNYFKRIKSNNGTMKTQSSQGSSFF